MDHFVFRLRKDGRYDISCSESVTPVELELIALFCRMFSLVWMWSQRKERQTAHIGSEKVLTMFNHEPDHNFNKEDIV